MKHRTNHFFKSFARGAKAHKGLTIFLVAVILIGGYEMVRAKQAGSGAPQYTVSPAVIGSIVQTVTGTGQVSAANQIDVTSQVSGAVTSIDAAVGEHVAKGQLLATIDDTSAANSLMSAKLSLAQLVEPAKQGDVANAQNSLSKSYSDALSSVRSAFTDLQTVIPGLNAMLYDQSGYLGPSNSESLTQSGIVYRNAAGVSFDAAKNSYDSLLLEYASLPTDSSTTTEDQLFSDVSDMLAKVATALKDTQAAITYIAANETQYHASGESTAASDVASWLSLVNSDVSAIGNDENTIAANANTLNNLLTGADPLQIQASELSVQQAQETYDNYFIRAPFDGVVGRIPVTLYSQASGSTVIATVIGDQMIADIALDEVDAAKVQVGQPATITFDAISGLVATGTVSQVDLVGTVSSGVVSYNVRIDIGTQDARIRPGMSLNVAITTQRKDGVVIVPTAAVKTLNGQSYVQVFDPSVLQAAGIGPNGKNGGSGRFGSSTMAFSASSTRAFNASSTGQFGGYGGYGGSSATGAASAAAAGGTPRPNRQISFTIQTAATPQDVPVTTGLSDDQNTEIVSGLQPRQLVVTRSSAGASASAAATPSILGALGGGARGGAVRAGGPVRIGG